MNGSCIFPLAPNERRSAHGEDHVNTSTQRPLADEPDRAQRLSVDPAAFGFHQIGWAVVADGGYVQSWDILMPNAGIVLSKKESDALIWEVHRNAGWMARRVGGDVGEVWESDTERLICWGDHIPAHRRRDASAVPVAAARDGTGDAG